MKVDFAFLAEHAEVVNGKLYVMSGAIDTFWTANVPFTCPKLSFVLRILFSAAEVDIKHKMELSLLTDDGKKIMPPIGGDLEIKRNPNQPKGWEHGFLAVMNIGNLKFPDFGDYSFELVINNTSQKSVPLRIVRAAQVQS